VVLNSLNHSGYQLSPAPAGLSLSGNGNQREFTIARCSEQNPTEERKIDLRRLMPTNPTSAGFSSLSVKLDKSVNKLTHAGPQRCKLVALPGALPP
jgi:hypothetical protein